MANDADLRRAIARGFFVVPTRLAGGASLTGRVLRFDTELDADERARLVDALIGPEPATHDEALGVAPAVHSSPERP